MQPSRDFFKGNETASQPHNFHIRDIFAPSSVDGGSNYVFSTHQPVNHHALPHRRIRSLQQLRRHTYVSRPGSTTASDLSTIEYQWQKEKLTFLFSLNKLNVILLLYPSHKVNETKDSRVFCQNFF